MVLSGTVKAKGANCCYLVLLQGIFSKRDCRDFADSRGDGKVAAFQSKKKFKKIDMRRMNMMDQFDQEISDRLQQEAKPLPLEYTEKI